MLPLFSAIPNANQLLEFHQSDVDFHSSKSSVDFDASFGGPIIAAPSVAVLQMVNI